MSDNEAVILQPLPDGTPLLDPDDDDFTPFWIQITKTDEMYVGGGMDRPAESGRSVRLDGWVFGATAYVSHSPESTENGGAS